MSQSNEIDCSLNSLLNVTKQKQQKSISLTTLPSIQTLSNPDDEYQLKDPFLNQQSSQKITKKNHIFVKLSTRVNGEQLSSNSIKLKHNYSEYQQVKSPAAKYQQGKDIKFLKDKSLSKISDKELQTLILKDEVKKLNIIIQNLQSKVNQKNLRNGKSLESNRDYGIRIETSKSQVLRKSIAKQQISKLEQTILDLQNKLFQLKIDVQDKNKEIKQIKRSHKQQIHKINFVVSQKFKAKQVQCSEMSKQLKQQKQIYHETKLKLAKITQDNKLLEAFVNQSKLKLKQQQQSLKRNKLIELRLQHCEKQMKYYNQELFKQKLQNSNTKKQNEGVIKQLTTVRKELHQIVLSPKADIYDKIVMLSQSISAKQIDNLDAKQNVKKIQKRQKQELIRREQKTNLLLKQSSEELIKLRLKLLNSQFSKKQF